MEIQKFETEDEVLKLFFDDCASSPREWDNLAKVMFFGKHRHLGDEFELDESECHSMEDVQQQILKEYNVAVMVPVYAYIHSGMTIATTPFSCPWDSGHLGFAIVTKEAIRDNWGIAKVTQKYIDHATRMLEGEIKTLDAYISGDVYGFVYEDSEGNEIDSCYGFYGDDLKTNGILDYVSESMATKILKEF